jgi:transposase
MLLADRGCDADWIRGLIWNRGGWANIPPKRHRKDPVNFSPYLYKDRNLIEPSSTRSSTFAASPPAMTSSPDARLSAPAR